jgi:UDP-N-acetylglucosamine:LPS N-acetylglucosamine transferase
MLIEDGARRERMREAARQCGTPRAAEAVASLLEEMAR